MCADCMDDATEDECEQFVNPGDAVEIQFDATCDSSCQCVFWKEKKKKKVI